MFKFYADGQEKIEFLTESECKDIENKMVNRIFADNRYANYINVVKKDFPCSIEVSFPPNVITIPKTKTEDFPKYVLVCSDTRYNNLQDISLAGFNEISTLKAIAKSIQETITNVVGFYDLDEKNMEIS